MISVDEAIEHLIGAVGVPDTETVPLGKATGRVLATPLSATLTQPPFDASAMDGYAVGEATGPEFDLIGTSQAGTGFDGTIGPGQCIRIFTGAPVPKGAAAVIMQEKARRDGKIVRFEGVTKPGQCIRLAGNDFVKGAALLQRGERLGPAAMNLAAAGGAAMVKVYRQPRIAIVSTGSELVPVGTAPTDHQIVASNATGLGALMAPWAAPITDCGIVNDQPEALTAALKSASNAADLVVSIGGVSVGDHDYVQECLTAMGAKTGFWRVAMRPGKPVLFATLGKTYFLGLPGNPVSALVTARVLGLPLLRALNGLAEPRDPPLRLPLAHDLDANGPRRHFMRARLTTHQNGQTTVARIPQTDSAHLSSFVQATALIAQPANSDRIPKGHPVDVLML
ncbi:MAG: molybdopterin molybdotransferase MoeA [Alphaproteobacteria bacterium]|nr:molybdopterin molybdotransferase MoeA [Alphaproteobacteria bacterium]